MHLEIPAHTQPQRPALAPKRVECAAQAEAHGLRVHEWQLNATPARISPPIANQPPEHLPHRSARDASAKAFFHAANAFETRVATLLMYNAAQLKRI